MTTPLLTYRGKHGVRVNLGRLVTSRMLLTANSGGGKSHAIRQLAEETHGKIQQIIIDREGEFSTLREKFPYLLVGPGGEVAADLKSAPVLARKLLELGVSAVIDLSEMDLKMQRQYVAAFADAISHAPRDLWHDVLVIFDEAYLFAPQRMKKGEGAAAASLAALSLAASTWRKRGFCMVLATTRVSKLDKDISGEMLNKLIGRTSEEDRKRAAEELGIDQNTAREMRAFKEGTFWAYGPAISDTPVLVETVKDLQTRPPKRGAAREAVPPTPVAIRAIADALAELPKEAAEEAHTIEGLKRQLVEVSRKLKHVPARTVERAVVDEKAIARAVEQERKRVLAAAHSERDAFISVVGRHIRTLTKFAEELEGNGRWLLETTAKLKNDLPNRGEGYGGSVKSVGEVVHHERHQSPVARGSTGPAKLPSSNPGSPLPKGERAILIAVAQHDDGVSREQLTQLTGYKRSSRDAYLVRLQSRGLITVGDRIIATEEGIAALGSDYEPLPTGRALYDHWMEKLPQGEKKILAVLADAYPEPLSRDAISDSTEYQRSSRDAYLARLKARKLIEDKNGGIKASDILFDQ
jgi:hypothetical protein